jgi:hypothetical protein
MAESVHLGQTADAAAGGATTHRRHHAAHAQGPASFQHVLMRAFQGKAAAGRFLGHQGHRAVARIPGAAASGKTATAPGASLHALNQAMAQEGVPASWQPALATIMARESSGRVDAKSPIHSARGLFQLTAANYHYNPNGAGSFGNAVEEAQGGIRYIRARYGTADKALAFWNQHHWY